MSTNITPENEHFLEYAVEVGMFRDRNEVINAAIDLLKRRKELIRDVNAGIEQLEQGRGKPMDIEAMLAAIDARLEVDRWEQGRGWDCRS